jgi:hypothetical protein
VLKRNLFRKDPVNQPVKTVAQLPCQAVRQSDKDLLEAIVLQKSIQELASGEGLPFDFAGEQGPDEHRAGMLLEVGKIIVYFFFQFLGFLS